MVRGKFRCDERTNTAWGGVRYKFMAVYDTTTEENRRFATATPSGSLDITVTNPAVNFTLGEEYYLDLTSAVVKVAEPTPGEAATSGQA